MKTYLRYFVVALLAIIGTGNPTFAQGPTPVAPTIASTLPAELTAYTLVPFDVQVTQGDETAASITGLLRVNDGAGNIAASNVVLEIDNNGTWEPLTFNMDGETNLPTATFATWDASLRIKLNAVGTFSYTLELLNESNGNILATTTNTSQAVFREPILDTTLDTYPEVIANKAYLFHPLVTAGDRAGEMVNLTFSLADASQAANVKLYRSTNSAGTAFEEVVLSNGTGTVGDEGGYALADAGAVGENLYKIIFSEAGVYNYSFKLVRNDGNAIAAANEIVTVLEGATIATTLNNREDVVASIAEDFTVTATAGAWPAATMVLGRLTLSDPAQAADISLSYQDEAGNYQPITIGADGVVTIGPAGGIALSELSGLGFRATFSEAGTYAYTLELIKVSGNEVIATSQESVVVRAFVGPTIASGLNNRGNVKTTVPEEFTATVSPGDVDLTTPVLGRLTLLNPARAANIKLEFRETATSAYQEIGFETDGTITLGEDGDILLGQMDKLDFRITFDAPGTYTYKLDLIRISDNEVLATETESVEVTAFENATIASNLNGRANVKTGVTQDFVVTTTPNDNAGAVVRGKLMLASASQAGNVALQYRTDAGTYVDLPIDENGVAYFGPETGFPLAATASQFKVTFNAAGTYPYTLSIVTVGGTETTLASASESVTVDAFQNATVVTTLGGQQVEKDATTAFAVTAVANDVDPATMVRGRLTLTDAAKAANVMLEYLGTDGNYQPIAFTNGVALIGPAEGMALSQINGLGFRVTFNAAGTYGYTLDLVAENGGAVVASATESVEVVATTSIKKGFEKGGIAVYPTLTTGAIKVDLVNARNASIQVIDMMGRVVVSEANAKGVVALDLSQVAKGTYVIKVQEGTKLNTQRVVVR